MTLQSKIVEMINDLQSSNEAVKVKLVAWPFSRKLVEAICEHKEFEFEYVRLDKRFEEFDIKVESDFELELKSMIKLINKEARESEKFTKQRNVIVEDIISQLLPENESDESAEVIDDVPVEDEMEGEDQHTEEESSFGCPECESTEYTKNGKFNDMQKYKCKECGHNFTEKSAVKFDA